MSCPKFEKQLTGYVDNQLPDAERSSIAEHVASCPRCADDLKTHVTLAEILACCFEPVDPRGDSWKTVCLRVDILAKRRRRSANIAEPQRHRDAEN